MSETTTVVIAGATGDLTQRKLLPALFNLRCKGRLPENLNVIGFARRPLTDDGYREMMWDGVREFGVDVLNFVFQMSMRGANKFAPSE